MKYALNLLQDTSLLGCKLVRTPMDTDVDLRNETGSLFEDIYQYERLICKLIHITFTKQDIAYDVGLVSQFMHSLERFIGKLS